MKQSVTEILGDIVSKLGNGLVIKVCDGRGNCHEQEDIHVNYIFGNDMYIKETLDTYSQKTPSGDRLPKFPLVALFTPVIENRDKPEYQGKARLNILIACSSRTEWTNEVREETSFRNILRPLYERLISELLKDRRLSAPYNGVLPHTYSENYSYGRYGAYTQSGQPLSEPIDAINVGNLEIIIENVKCNKRERQ